MEFEDNGEVLVCPDCGHELGSRIQLMPGRWLLGKLGFKLKPRLVKCSETQTYEDDELSACGCRNPIHT